MVPVMSLRYPTIKVYNKKYLPATLEEENMATAKKTLAVLLLCFVSTPAWAQAGKNQPQNNNPQVYDTTRAPIAGTEPVGQPIDPKSYQIGAEDILKIEVFRDPEFSRLVNVRPDGKITLPLVNDLQAAGLTPERLTAQLTEALTQFMINPQVTITVMAVNSKSFTVTGRVNRSGKFPLATPIRVFDALGLAGGFQDFANTKKITIVRGGERLEFNYNDYVKGKKEALDQNILLQNGDTVLVK